MDTAILEDLGMTNAEIKVYLALLELGTSTAGPIIDKTNLQNSVVHMTLHKLMDKGFISFIKKGQIKHYQAADPKIILKFIDEKRAKFEELMPELIARQTPPEPQEAEVFEGMKGFKVMLDEFIEGAKKGDEYLFFSFFTEHHENFKNVYAYYNEFEKVRAAKGIITKGLAPPTIKEQFKGRENVKFVKTPIPLNISVFKNKVVFTPWEDDKISFMITSRQLAESFRTYFYSVYN